MIVLLLLLIISVLLFGSTAVLGMAGFLIGLIVVIAGLVFIEASFSLPPGTMASLLFWGFFVLCGALLVWYWLDPELRRSYHEQEKKKLERRKDK
jgi:hypothetical protein